MRTKVKKTYASDAMAERRTRIIDEAHKILAEGGEPALTIERLSKQSDVAPRTIYRAYGNKEGVIFATVAERLKEVRETIARHDRDYSIKEVFEEFDWIISEMYRDYEYARLVIEFYFSRNPKIAAIRELRSVSYNRFRNWLDRAIRRGATREQLDLDKIAREMVDTEYIVYHRWAFYGLSRDECALELRANFLKSAILVLAEPACQRYVDMLVDIQRQLGRTALFAAAAADRPEHRLRGQFSGKA